MQTVFLGTFAPYIFVFVATEVLLLKRKTQRILGQRYVRAWMSSIVGRYSSSRVLDIQPIYARIIALKREVLFIKSNEGKRTIFGASFSIYVA